MDIKINRCLKLNNQLPATYVPNRVSIKKCCETCNWDSPIANNLVRLVSFCSLASVSWMKTFSLMLFHNFSIGTEIINHLMTYTSCFYICIFRQTTRHAYFYFKHVYHLSLFWKPLWLFSLHRITFYGLSMTINIIIIKQNCPENKLALHIKFEGIKTCIS